VGDAEFVCLPELSTTGIVFGKMDKLAEPIPGPTTQEFSKIARTHSVYLIAGIVKREEQTGTLHNANLLISLQGELLQKYRKTFLYLDENKGFVPGDQPCICELPFW